MLDTVTALTPLPPWWWVDQDHDNGDDGAEALVSAVRGLVVAGLAGHAAVVAGEPVLIDTVCAREGVTYVWTVEVDHDDACPCRGDQ